MLVQAGPPQTSNTQLMLWRKILQVLQNRPGSLAHNNLVITDPLYVILVKVLRALQKK